MLICRADHSRIKLRQWALTGPILCVEVPFNVNANTFCQGKFPVSNNPEDFRGSDFSTGHVRSLWTCGRIDEYHARQSNFAPKSFCEYNVPKTYFFFHVDENVANEVQCAVREELRALKLFSDWHQRLW